VKVKLATDRDQALLAIVIREAAGAASQRKWYVGRTALQKILYFVKAAGVPMGYQFDVYHYGPFCADIMSDAEYLIADGAVKDIAQKDKYSNYRATRSADDLIESHWNELKQHADTVRDIARALAPLEPKMLEFYSTLDYVYRWVKAPKKAGPLKPRVIARFLEVKPGAFAEHEIAEAYDQMVNVGAFEP